MVVADPVGNVRAGEVGATISVLLVATPALVGNARKAHPHDETSLWRGDRLALRLGLVIARAWGARVSTVSMGSFDPGMTSLGPVRGADESIWLLGGTEGCYVDRARALSTACHGSGVILAGSRGPGRGSGATPVFVAGFLNAACMSDVVRVEPGPPGVLLAERRLDHDWIETAEVVAPCVLTCP